MRVVNCQLYDKAIMLWNISFWTIWKILVRISLSKLWDVYSQRLREFTGKKKANDWLTFSVLRCNMSWTIFLWFYSLGIYLISLSRICPMQLVSPRRSRRPLKGYVFACLDSMTLTLHSLMRIILFFLVSLRQWVLIEHSSLKHI